MRMGVVAIAHSSVVYPICSQRTLSLLPENRKGALETNGLSGESG